MTGIASMMASSTLAGLTVKASTLALSATGSVSTIATGSVAAQATGYDTPLISKPLTYAWVIIPGTGAIAAISPTKASCSFGATGMARGETRTCKAYCNVTQVASGKTGRTPDVTITITRSSFLTRRL